MEPTSATPSGWLLFKVAEVLACPNTPAGIGINESLQIARRYAAPESVQFLNGVVDAIARSVLKQRHA